MPARHPRSPFTILRQLLLIVLCLLPQVQVHAEFNSENQLKAAFLVNFLKYVEFPSTSTSTVTICLFGRDTLGPYLGNFEGRSVAGKELRIRRINTRDQVASCQLLFIPETEENRFVIPLNWVDSLPVLTVSDLDTFTRLGGGIALVRSDGRLQFDINADALNRIGLKPSYQMLRLARQVIGGGK